jgi:hypothetical protein
MRVDRAAEETASVVLALAAPKRFAGKGSAYTPLLKLPPVFTGGGGGKYGDPKRNLVAMVRTLSEYEIGKAERLSDLPSLYNAHGGLPSMGEDSLRRVHNWSQQVAFAVRAAAIERERRAGADREAGIRRVYERLFGSEGGSRRTAFVAYATDSPYQLRPLRYATREAILRWIGQEWDQREAGCAGADYGARPTPQEWESFGLKGQTRPLSASVHHELARLVAAALAEDDTGRYSQADLIDRQIAAIEKNIEKLGL